MLPRAAAFDFGSSGAANCSADDKTNALYENYALQLRMGMRMKTKAKTKNTNQSYASSISRSKLEHGAGRTGEETDSQNRAPKNVAH